MNIHSNPQLVRFMFDHPNCRELFIDTVLAVRDVGGLRKINFASFRIPKRCELFTASIDETLTLQGVKKREPGRLLLQQLLILRIAPIE